MTGADGKEASIELVSHDEGRKTLGTYIAPSGSWDTAIMKMLKKVDKRIAAARKVKVERRDMWLGTKMMLKTTIEYPLTAMYADKRQWDQVDKKIRKTYLPKSGFNSNLPAAILQGPKRCLGLGRPLTTTRQGSLHIEELARGKREDEDVQF